MALDRSVTLPLDIMSFYSDDSSATRSPSYVQTTQTSGDKSFYWHVPVPSYPVNFTAGSLRLREIKILREGSQNWWNKYLYRYDKNGTATVEWSNTSAYSDDATYTMNVPFDDADSRYVFRVITTGALGVQAKKIYGIQYKFDWIATEFGVGSGVQIGTKDLTTSWQSLIQLNYTPTTASSDLLVLGVVECLWKTAGGIGANEVFLKIDVVSGPNLDEKTVSVEENNIRFSSTGLMAYYSPASASAKSYQLKAKQGWIWI